MKKDHYIGVDNSKKTIDVAIYVKNPTGKFQTSLTIVFLLRRLIALAYSQPYSPSLIKLKQSLFRLLRSFMVKKISRDESQPLEKSMRTVSQALAAAELATYQFAISDISVPVP
jgi:hypothetical protein